MGASSEAGAAVGYGARPVSVDLTRGRTLTATPTRPQPGRVAMAPPAPARDRNAADRLSVKHWTRGHRILVCSLTGGTGRTTVAAMVAATLAGLPYAHYWPPVLLVDGAPRHLDPHLPRETNDRSESPGTAVGSALLLRTAPSGVKLLHPTCPDRLVRAVQVQAAVAAIEDGYAPVIIDHPAGLPSDTNWTAEATAGFSIVLVVRPDEYNHTAAADALVWMHNRQLVAKHQVIVVVNHGVGTRTRRSLSSAAALAVRCHGLHQLPADPRLGPSPLPPVTRPVPDRLRLRLAQICLDIWHTSQTITTPHPEPNSADSRQENQ